MRESRVQGAVAILKFGKLEPQVNLSLKETGWLERESHAELTSLPTIFSSLNEKP